VLLGGAEGVSKRAERRRGAASELGGGPDLDLGERPFFLLIQAGQGVGGLKRRSFDYCCCCDLGWVVLFKNFTEGGLQVEWRVRGISAFAEVKTGPEGERSGEEIEGKRD